MIRREAASSRWSSAVAFCLAAIGAAVGLGSIWRFPYLAGSHGGSSFILLFILACLAIATPLLIAELALGRRARRSPPEAAGEIAASYGYSRTWNCIGVIGTVATFLISSYYTVIAGWVMAYTWKYLSGELTGLAHSRITAHFSDFIASPLQVGAWHLAFNVMVCVISARGVNRGIELADRIRAPSLLIVLLILLAYALATGDVERSLAFAFALDFSKISAEMLLTAIGQAFYATGVGMAVMIAYGAYVPTGVSLVRSAMIVSASIVCVSLLATLIVFPLMFRYGLNPAEGTDLVFKVLPLAFAEMPAGRLIGTLFFLLLLLAALTPSVAAIEPVVAWLEQRCDLSRSRAALATCAGIWALGVASVLSFNVWDAWYPLASIARYDGMTFFTVLDYFSSDVLLPLGALLTCAFIGWRLPRSFSDSELPEQGAGMRRTVRTLLRYVCPAAIVAGLVASLYM